MPTSDAFTRAAGRGRWLLARAAAAAPGEPFAGSRVHDARVAALCRYHAITGLWSADRDFSRFPDLAVLNPLVTSQ